jgi:hypothetical protein
MRCFRVIGFSKMISLASLLSPAVRRITHSTHGAALVVFTVGLTCLPTELNGQDTVLVPIHRNGRFGYVNSRGGDVLAPRFERAKPFSESLAPVRESGRWGYINRTGVFVIPPRYDEAEPFSEGYAAVRMDGKYGFINRNGVIVVQPTLDIAKPFSEGRAAVKFGTEWLYINRQGSDALGSSYRFEMADGFHEGLAAVRVSGRWGYIDHTGSLVIPPRYYDAKAFASGLAPVRVGPFPSGLVGYINHQNQMVLPPTFRWGEPFAEGLAAVQLGERWAYIDVHGSQVIAPRFVLARGFRGGLAIVHDAVFNRPLYVDRSGNIVVPASDTRASGAFGSSRSLQRVTLRSTPAGAEVYLIPLFDWQNSPGIRTNAQQLLLFRVPESPTNAQTRALEEKYIVLFVLGNRIRTTPLDVTNGGNNTASVSFTTP